MFTKVGISIYLAVAAELVDKNSACLADQNSLLEWGTDALSSLFLLDVTT